MNTIVFTAWSLASVFVAIMLSRRLFNSQTSSKNMHFPSYVIHHGMALFPLLMLIMLSIAIDLQDTYDRIPSGEFTIKTFLAMSSIMVCFALKYHQSKTIPDLTIESE